MGVSLIGLDNRAATVRRVALLALVAVSLFVYLYGPPVAERMFRAAQDRCNALTGEDFRNYRLEWRTVSWRSLERPHWMCLDLEDRSDRGTDLGWWVDL